jgi:peptidoglycan pentaglycine glycine transferase (the first glycine)
MRVLESTRPDFLDPSAWDEFVACDPRGHLLQTWAWGQLKGTFGWTPVRLAIEQDGTLVAGAQVLYRKVGPLCLGYIPKGPVFAQENAESAETLWCAVHTCSRRMRAIALKVEPEWRDDDTQAHTVLSMHRFAPSQECIQPRRTIIVDLRAGEEQILARMKSKWRYNIHLSERKGVEVREVGLAGLGDFYALMRITGERDRFGIHTLEYYRQALELFTKTGRATLFMAYCEGQPLAGLMPYAFNGQAWYMYGASANEHRELMPNHQLQWRAMQWAKSKGCYQYDLWGIPDVGEEAPTAALGGVQRFKEGFGGEVVRYMGAYDYVYSQPLHWLTTRVWAWRRARRAAPQMPNSA